MLPRPSKYCTLNRDPAAPWPVGVDDLQQVRRLNPGRVFAASFPLLPTTAWLTSTSWGFGPWRLCLIRPLDIFFNLTYLDKKKKKINKNIVYICVYKSYVFN